jgi:transcriptional regulator with XRE-family HTH domain
LGGPLALKLRLLRAERAWTIEEAARHAGVTPETISDAEHGKRRTYLPTLRKIAAGYGVPMEELLKAEDQALVAGKVKTPDTGLPSYEQLVDANANLERENATLREVIQELEAALAPENLLEALHVAGFPSGWAEAEEIARHLRRSLEYEEHEPGER